MKLVFGTLVLACAVAAAASAQSQQQPPPVPQPYPRPGQPAAPKTGQQPARPATPEQTAPSAPKTASTQPAETPGEATLGLPIYPSAQFITSYDAGRGQRYYLFGTTASFADVVSYYKSVLRQKGELVFDEPAIHLFEVGRFREETMAFPPSITVKDYTWGGSKGYLNPKPGAEPARFATILQVVPIPPATAEPRR
jgi:hypothetical protein